MKRGSAALLLLIWLPGCGFTRSTEPTGMRFSSSTSLSLVGLCKRVTLQLVSSRATPAVATDSVTFPLSASGVTLYADHTCRGEALRELTVPAGRGSADLFVKAGAPGAGRIQTFQAFGPVSFSLEVRPALSPSLALGSDTLSSPQGVSLGDGGLMVADSGNNRVLLWSSLPTLSGTAADLVLGQADRVSVDAGLAADRMSAPMGVVRHQNRLFVADLGNHRVLGWDALPQADGGPASLVLGQPDAISATPNSGGLSARSLFLPTGVAYVGDQLFVSDSGNSRVLVWNEIPSQSFATADALLGLSTFTSPKGSSATAQTMQFPAYLHLDHNVVTLADSQWNRAMIWSPFPSASDAASSAILGQPDTASTGPSTGALGLDSVSDALWTGDWLVVADTANNRVLLWNGIPSTGAAPDAIIGPSDFDSSSAASLVSPVALDYANGYLAVSDNGNNRVLLYQMP